MKKILFGAAFCGAMMFMAVGAQAQFRSVPAMVTDSFKAKYPGASAVTWTDKLLAGGFQASFTEGKEKFDARFGNKGEWQWSSKKIAKDAIPGPVRDGLSKSKYAGADWEVKTVTMKFLPGNIVQYILFVEKSDLNKKNLLFSSEGQLLRDGATL
ncbi:hypothetical protein [Puia sp.]|jgi:hypothetical protein|uniref:hypothetical protein n=1 Tax=Puia sp. TaxID=2045100 RepID=UPI002F3E79B7